MIKSAVLILILSGSTAWAQGLNIANPRVEQGDTLIAFIESQWQGPLVCVSAFNKHYIPDRYGQVIIGVSADMEPSGTRKMPGKYIATLVECGRGVRLGLSYAEFEVLRKDYPKTRTAGRNRSTRPRQGLEIKKINEAFSTANTTSPDLTNLSPFSYPFQPIPSRLDINFQGIISDPFGLIYRNNSRLGHYGIDFRMPVGTPVLSTNTGIVVLVARNFSKEGNMIIINHGRGIFSVYMHLSKIDVTEGENIELGQVIGLSGATGAGVREPHLHFNIKVNGVYVDPLIFISTVNQYSTRQ